MAVSACPSERERTRKRERESHREKQTELRRDTQKKRNRQKGIIESNGKVCTKRLEGFLPDRTLRTST